jgi:hypothetical protein
MKTVKEHNITSRPHLAVIVGATLVALVIGTAPAHAGPSKVVVVGNPTADILVWTDDTWDVYPSYDDVVISIRARRDCYATVFVVDTDGYLHVIRPYSAFDDAWVEAGVTYRYYGYEIGLGALAGRGIAYVFAVGSPYPFDYSHYGVGLFAGGYGYRVFGDPFVACRHLYVSLLPARCNWDLVFVGFTRFYVREWVRYPGYLCHGHHGPAVHVRAGSYCRHCYRVYDSYREHANDPYEVIRPRSRTRYKTAEQTTIKPTARAYKEKIKTRPAHRVPTRQARVANGAKIVSAKRTSRVKTAKATTGKQGVAVSNSRVVKKTNHNAVAGRSKSVGTSVQKGSKTKSPTTGAQGKGTKRITSVKSSNSPQKVSKVETSNKAKTR